MVETRVWYELIKWLVLVADVTRSDWLIVGYYSPVMNTGRLQACKDKAKRHVKNTLLASNYRSLWENLKPRPSRIDVAIARSSSPSEISPWRPHPKLVSSYSYLLVLFVSHRTPNMRIIRYDSMWQLSVPVFEKICNLCVSFCCGG